MVNKLFAMNLDGNLHDAVRRINWAYPEIVDGIVAMDFSGHYTIVVYRHPWDVHGNRRKPDPPP